MKESKIPKLLLSERLHNFYVAAFVEYTVHAADTVCLCVRVCVVASSCYMSSAAGCVLQRKAMSCLHCAVCATLEQ